ncbi:hypothetical protein [Pedobacter sp. HMWF019]|uniref:hypothetical protein n=1 Tax=Pedobacter sp. HMWF019 TaxID=2056856 RepID=UPI0011B22FB0|nr:hypothetical protein [Pedobacter sp. HMWF019]
MIPLKNILNAKQRNLLLINGWHISFLMMLFGAISIQYDHYVIMTLLFSPFCAYVIFSIYLLRTRIKINKDKILKITKWQRN